MMRKKARKMRLILMTRDFDAAVFIISPKPIFLQGRGREEELISNLLKVIPCKQVSVQMLIWRLILSQGL